MVTVIEVSKLSKLERVLVFSGSLEQGTIVTCLARRNDTFYVPSWTLLGTKKVETKVSKVTATVVTVVFEGSKVKALEALGYGSFCVIMRAHCLRQEQEKAKDLWLEAIDVVPAEDTDEVVAPELIIDSQSHPGDVTGRSVGNHESASIATFTMAFTQINLHCKSALSVLARRVLRDHP